MVLEHVVVFARLVGCYGAARLNDIFARYEELRRKRINAAYDEANLRWKLTKDFGWLAQSMKEWLVPIFLWWSNQGAEQSIRRRFDRLAIAQLDNQHSEIRP